MQKMSASEASSSSRESSELVSGSRSIIWVAISVAIYELALNET